MLNGSRLQMVDVLNIQYTIRFTQLQTEKTQNIMSVYGKSQIWKTFLSYEKLFFREGSTNAQHYIMAMLHF